MSHYTPHPQRYSNQAFFRRCGRSGLKLPLISLGCWHNFGEEADPANGRAMLYAAFDHGITHFDLANNYGPPPGSAERNVAPILRDMPRDELIISTKAGYGMWSGPYGNGGSRKYLLASLDQSLRRLGLDYVDIFYHHRPDPDTPMEETLGALDTAVRQGKALYAGVSNYNRAQTRKAVEICRKEGFSRLLINQVSYSLFNRWIEKDLLPAVEEAGVGVIAFCPLAQGMLTDRYLKGIPADSRAASRTGFLKREQVTEEALAKVRRLNEHAQQRGQSLAQMALAWVVRDPRLTSALIGASRPEQITENVKAMENADFTADELRLLDEIVK